MSESAARRVRTPVVVGLAVYFVGIFLAGIVLMATLGWVAELAVFIDAFTEDWSVWRADAAVYRRNRHSAAKFSEIFVLAFFWAVLWMPFVLYSRLSHGLWPHQKGSRPKY